MNTYVINEGYSGTRNVDAEWFKTEGDFIDFYGRDVTGNPEIIFRTRASEIATIELKTTASAA